MTRLVVSATTSLEVVVVQVIGHDGAADDHDDYR